MRTEERFLSEDPGERDPAADPCLKALRQSAERRSDDVPTLRHSGSLHITLNTLR